MFELFNEYKNHKISREEFCRKLATMQGFSNEIRGANDATGAFITYRGRRAELAGNALIWQEKNGAYYKASSYKELKIKIDIMEIKAA